MVAALAAPSSASADEYAAVRTRFRVAYAAAQAGGSASTATDDDALRAYPLYPYLQSARLEHDLGADAAIAEFLDGARRGALYTQPARRVARGSWQTQAVGNLSGALRRRRRHQRHAALLRSHRPGRARPPRRPRRGRRRAMAHAEQSPRCLRPGVRLAPLAQPPDRRTHRATRTHGACGWRATTRAISREIAARADRGPAPAVGGPDRASRTVHRRSAGGSRNAT